jgi:hypothetical protein
MAPEHIECSPREEVAICAQWHLVCTFSLICNYTVQSSLRGLGLDYLDANLEPDREREANDIKAWAYVCGGTGDFCCALARVSIGWGWVVLMVIIMIGVGAHGFVGQWRRERGGGGLLYFREFLVQPCGCGHF